MTHRCSHRVPACKRRPTCHTAHCMFGHFRVLHPNIQTRCRFPPATRFPSDILMCCPFSVCLSTMRRWTLRPLRGPTGKLMLAGGAQGLLFSAHDFTNTTYTPTRISVGKPSISPGCRDRCPHWCGRQNPKRPNPKRPAARLPLE